MTSPISTPNFLKFFNLKKISEETGIDKFKLYNNFNGRYNSLTRSDKKKIAKSLYPQVKLFFENLGYDIVLTKKDEI